MTTTADNETVKVNVAAGHVLRHGTGVMQGTADHPADYAEKTYKAGEQVELPAADARRLRALGVVTLPDIDAPAAGASDDAGRDKARVQITPKDGPSIKR